MKRALVFMPVLAIIGVLLVAPGVALADQAMHTVRAPFNSLNESAYPLRGGFVVVTHINGPVNFEKKEFQLHGAKPNTELFLYRTFAEPVGPYPAGTPFYAGYSLWTNERGNGHIMTKESPTGPSMSLLKTLGIEHLTITNVLYDGLLVKDGGAGGTPAYASDSYVTYFDWEWTP